VIKGDDEVDILLLGPLGALGFSQPDGSFVTTLADLAQRLAEMAATGEAAVLDGLATRVQRPRSWANQKVLYDAKRHTHTAQGIAVTTVDGDLLWCDGGWPGSCHEHELLALSGVDRVLDAAEVTTLVDRGFRGWPRPGCTGTPRSVTGAPQIGAPSRNGPTTAARRGCGRWWSSRSGIWATPGRCAAGGGCCSGSAMSFAPPPRWSVSAGGSTGYLPEQASRTPSVTGIPPSTSRTAV